MKALVVILDTLRRDYLEPYGASWVRTPSIARLAERSVVCDNHWVGSLPCMPARRELMTGRHNFLERGWGPLEPFDDVLPEQLRRREGKRPVFSHLITDHYHYFYLGGEGHNNSFSTWQFERGQEGDVWISRVDLPALPEAIGRLKARPQNALNRLAQREEHEFSGPRCVEHCRRWLDDNGAADDWLVQLELFDPHEPFYVVRQYLDLYGDRRRATRSTPPRRAVPSCRPRRRARATTPATSSTTWPPTLARRGRSGTTRSRHASATSCAPSSAGSPRPRSIGPASACDGPAVVRGRQARSYDEPARSSRPVRARPALALAAEHLRSLPADRRPLVPLAV